MEVDARDGGRLTGLTVAGHEVLGASVDRAVPEAMRHGCFPMVPFAGRIAHGELPFGGRTWTVPLNLGSSAAHGVAFDVPWTVERADDEEVELRVELDARWPFGGSARQVVRILDDGVQVELSVANEERSMPAMLGLHPWFDRRLGGQAPTIEVSVPDPGSLPPRPWDVCLPGLDEPPRAQWADADLVVQADTTTWTVYEQDSDAFCLEPLTHPVGAMAAGTAAVVEPGRPLSLTTRFRLVPR